jgi:hypothetical protein
MYAEANLLTGSNANRHYEEYDSDLYANGDPLSAGSSSAELQHAQAQHATVVSHSHGGVQGASRAAVLHQPGRYTSLVGSRHSNVSFARCLFFPTNFGARRRRRRRWWFLLMHLRRFRRRDSPSFCHPLAGDAGKPFPSSLFFVCLRLPRARVHSLAGGLVDGAVINSKAQPVVAIKGPAGAAGGSSGAG